MSCETLHTALLLSLLLCCVSHATAKVARTDAFIGYTERAAGGGACKDNERGCAGWKDAHECLLNPAWMRENCARSCGSCSTNERAGGRLPGYATPEDTKQFSAYYPARSFTPVAETHFRYDPSMSNFEVPGEMRTRPWITLSSIAIGTYLGDESASTDEQVINAIVKSVGRGCNVIDTARNYRGGRGEDAVMRAIHMLARNRIKRTSLFISTKAGFMPEDLQWELLSSKRVKRKDIHGGSHCMHPSCLRASLEQSLATLNLETVDLLYLHNAAEMQLQEIGRDRFMVRLKAAFQMLESFRKEGKIRAYGMATWTCFRVAPDSPQYLSLQDVVDLAVQAGGLNHGFRYVQLPISAGMRQAWEEHWQTVRLPPGSPHKSGFLTLPFTTAAARAGIGVFGSGPLQEAALLKDTVLLEKLKAVPELSRIKGSGAALLQLARSTPYVTSAVVGHQTPSHVQQNLAVTQANILEHDVFLRIMERLSS